MLQSIRSMPPASQVKFSSAVQVLCLLGLAFLAAASMSAQDIIMSAPRMPTIPLVLRDQLPPAPASLPPAPADTPFKFGSVVLHPRLSYSYMNSEGLPAPDGRRIASEIYTVASGLSVDLGEHWSLDYSPTWVNYTSGAMSDSFDQSASLSGSYSIRDMGVHFSENYSQSSPTLVETGQQTKQKSSGTSLGASYSYSPKVQFQVSGSMNGQRTDIATDTRSWSSSAALNLVLSPRFSLNLGSSFGYDEIADAPDMYNDGFNAAANWHPTDKLSIALSTGRQFSHSTSSASVTLSNPLLNLNLGYQPFETTSVNFSVSRTVPPSYFKRQEAATYRWSVGFNQRLLTRFYFNASYAPFDTTYTATDTLTVAGRKDSVKSYNAGLSTQLFGRLSVSATFAKTQNNSNVSGFSFSSKQYGFRLSYSY